MYMTLTHNTTKFNEQADEATDHLQVTRICFIENGCLQL